MPYREPACGDGGQKAPSLGSIQANGSTQVLQQWGQPDPQPATSASSAAKPRPRGASQAPAQAAAADGPAPAVELEWSSMSDAAKQALRQWVAGQVGGRHCMLVLEHGAGSADMRPSQEDGMDLSALRAGALLNVLSGLRGGVGLVAGRAEGGWLFEAIFSKTAAQVLEDALKAALDQIGDQRISKPGDLSAEQAHLALRRLHMDAQSRASSADEATRVQIWLELARLHFQGPPREPAPGGAGQAPPARERDRSKATAERPWHDGEVLGKLGKAEVDLEAESQQMSLETLRTQNRSIEEYVMRLVRQRDELKQVVKLAEQRDSYFILGLDGPDATEEQVKKAYRNLARKEHPDKAGIGNKRRFQAIQQAYQNILRRRQEGAGSAPSSPSAAASRRKDEDGKAGKTVAAAELEALRARDAAHLVAACAHRTLLASEDCPEQAQGLPKRRALDALRGSTGASVSELQLAAHHLRKLGEAVCAVSRLAEDVMAEHQEHATGGVAGVGLRDRAVILEDAGRSAASSAELLEKICEATQATLQKVEKAAPEGGGSGGGGPKRGGEAANLLSIGVKLLGESLSRTSAVARRSADEAITGATKALELAHGLAALEQEARRERRRKAERERGFDEDEPVAAPDAEDACADGERAGRKREPASSTSARREKSPGGRPDSANSNATPRGKLKSAAARVKERHVALRVKNLRFLASLNEEALKAKAKLGELLERSQGALLPDVSVPQRNQLFSLVEQIFDFALAETARLVTNPNAPPGRILDRSLGFALALEHGQEIALPTDSRTQALKLALLIDKSLLGQVIDGPFRQRLAAFGARRKAAADAALGHQRIRGPQGSSATASVARQWEDAAHSYCDRIGHGVCRALEQQQEPAGAR